MSARVWSPGDSAFSDQHPDIETEQRLRNASVSSTGSDSTDSGNELSKSGEYELNHDVVDAQNNSETLDHTEPNQILQLKPETDELEDAKNGNLGRTVQAGDTSEVDSENNEAKDIQGTNRTKSESSESESEDQRQKNSQTESAKAHPSDQHAKNIENAADDKVRDFNANETEPSRFGFKNPAFEDKAECNSIESEHLESPKVFDTSKQRDSFVSSDDSDPGIELETVPTVKHSTELPSDSEIETVTMEASPSLQASKTDPANGVVTPTEMDKREGLDENKNTESDSHVPEEGKNNNAAGKPSDFHEVIVASESDPELEALRLPRKDIEKGVDEPDLASVYSLFMERNLRYFFQHPYARFSIAYLITFCNFYMFAEDPIAHSLAEATIPVLGNCFCFIVLKYPPNAWSFLKVLMWISAIIIGCIVGKKIVHQKFLQGVVRLKMFAKDQGSWLIMAITTLMSLFIMSWVYNLLLLAGGEGMKKYKIDAYLGMTNSRFARLAAVGTWSGDFLTAWIVTDVMLQEQLYPKWATWARRWWRVGVRRIIVFWVVTFSAFFIVLLVIATNWIDWDTLNAKFVATNEASRSFLASFILVMDLLIVMQDWDFPHFINAMNIKLPGLNTANVKFNIPKCLRKQELWEVHITGKWMNYGVIIIVMLLDLNMWKTQMFYDPFVYGQYTGPDNRIYSVRDEGSLLHNETYLNFAWRNSNINPDTNQTYIMGDHVTNSKRMGYGLAVTCLAFIPSGVAFIAFVFFIVYFGREKPTPADPHAGRLKKRKRRVRFSLKNLRRSITRRRKKKQASVLSQGQDGAEGQGDTDRDGQDQNHDREGRTKNLDEVTSDA